MGFGKMFVGGSGWRVFAVGRGEWWSGAESGAGAGGELSGLSCGHQKTQGRAPCDAEPGCERDYESLIVSGRFQLTTLKQPQRHHDESQNAPDSIRIDLGDG